MESVPTGVKPFFNQNTLSYLILSYLNIRGGGGGTPYCGMADFSSFYQGFLPYKHKLKDFLYQVICGCVCK